MHQTILKARYAFIVIVCVGILLPVQNALADGRYRNPDHQAYRGHGYQGKQAEHGRGRMRHGESAYGHGRQQRRHYTGRRWYRGDAQRYRYDRHSYWPRHQYSRSVNYNDHGTQYRTRNEHYYQPFWNLVFGR